MTSAAAHQYKKQLHINTTVDCRLAIAPVTLHCCCTLSRCPPQARSPTAAAGCRYHQAQNLRGARRGMKGFECEEDCFEFRSGSTVCTYVKQR